MQLISRIMVLTAGALFLGTVAIAAENEGAPSVETMTVEQIRDMEPAERRAFLDNLSEADRATLKARIEVAREKRRAEYNAMTPEEKDAARKERRARYDALSDEEKKELKDRMKKQSAKRREQAKAAREKAEESKP